MASILGFARRAWTIHNPPEAAKAPDALKIGLLGASWIAYGILFLTNSSSRLM
jgi:hypothetical protein